MFKNINLDHCYNEDSNFAFFKKLGKLGFTLEPDMVEHPGKAYCKFIALQAKNPRERFYLEFVHYGKGGLTENMPGLSFNYKTNLEKFANKISKKIKINYSHKNYEWKENSIDRLPGWNMLNFKHQPITGTTTWFTEFEANPKIPKRKKIKIHPNSVYSIHGIKLILTLRSKKRLELIFGKKLSQKTKFSDGTFLYIEDGKKDKVETLILNCKSLKKASVYMKNEFRDTFAGNEAIRIKNNSKQSYLMWDLLIIEN